VLQRLADGQIYKCAVMANCAVMADPALAVFSLLANVGSGTSAAAAHQPGQLAQPGTASILVPLSPSCGRQERELARCTSEDSPASRVRAVLASNEVSENGQEAD
jgi:hypothetical protein